MLVSVRHGEGQAARQKAQSNKAVRKAENKIQADRLGQVRATPARSGLRALPTLCVSAVYLSHGKTEVQGNTCLGCNSVVSVSQTS